VYFEEIREIATDADLLLDAMDGIDLTNRNSPSAALGIENSRNQLRSSFHTFQVIQQQCWRLKREVEAERNAFGALAEKVGLHVFSSNDSSCSYAEVVSFLEEQKVGLDSLNNALDSLVKPISQSVNALFFINKFFDFSDGSLDKPQALSSSAASASIQAISTAAELCLEDINRLATNIQIHDLVRQRLEHIDQVYEQLLHELASAESNGLIPKYLSMVPELTRLHTAQLESTKEECMGTFSAIRNVLNTIDERMSDALESFVRVSCFRRCLDDDFNHKIEGLLVHSLPSIADGEQKYIKAVGDLQASFRGLKIRLLRMRGSVVDYLNASASNSSSEMSNGFFFDEMEALVVATRSMLLKFGVEVSNSIRLFAEVADAMNFVDEAYGSSHEAFYNESVYLLYAKKCGSKEDNPIFTVLSDEDNTREVHDKYTDFFSKKISEVIDDLDKLSRQPRLLNASKEHIRHGFNKIEKVYTMQCEREIHRRIYSEIVGNDFEACSSAMAECATDEDNLELF
jgi:hypothetical protein